MNNVYRKKVSHLLFVRRKKQTLSFVLAATDKTRKKKTKAFILSPHLLFDQCYQLSAHVPINVQIPDRAKSQMKLKTS